LKSQECCALLVQTIEKFGGRQPRKLLSDNHRAFRSRIFKGLLRRLGIRAVHSSVHHPQTLGKVERFNRTFQENAWLFEGPQAFLRYYNYERVHSSLQGKTPADRYFPSKEFRSKSAISSLGRTVTKLG
jgi:transposase InsO family protein